MNKIQLFLLVAFTFTLFCCDDATHDGVNFTTPLNIGNYWTYDISGSAGNFRDSLYVSNDTVISSYTYKKFKTQNNTAFGFYASALRNNAVRTKKGMLLLTGDLSLNSGASLPIAIDLSLTDFVIFNKNATNNQALNKTAKTGTITDTFSGVPLTINYSLQSYGGENLATFTAPDGTIYTNIKTTKIKLNATISTVVSGISIPVLASQDVLVSTQYLADGIGVVYTNTVTSYALNALAASQLNVPASNSQTQEEILDTYLAN